MALTMLSNNKARWSEKPQSRKSFEKHSTHTRQCWALQEQTTLLWRAPYSEGTCRALVLWRKSCRSYRDDPSLSPACCIFVFGLGEIDRRYQSSRNLAIIVRVSVVIQLQLLSTAADFLAILPLNAAWILTALQWALAVEASARSSCA